MRKRERKITEPMINYFNRQCQECGHYQIDNEPDNTKPLSESYQSRKCNHCGSESLDYGSFKFERNDEDVL